MNRKPELTKQESEGFDRFVREHYAKSMYQAGEAYRDYRHMNPETNWTFDREDLAVLAIFDKIASPRVYLIDSWRKLSSEEHMVYSYPDPVEREKAKAEAMRISKQVGEMITT